MTKGNGNNKKQGIVSWATSVMSLLIGFSNIAARVQETLARPAGYGSKWAFFGERMMMDYAGFDSLDNTFNAKRMIRGYAPIAAAIAFKKGTSYLAKTAPIKSLIPRLGF